MFTIQNDIIKYPIKVWLPDEDLLQGKNLEQAIHLANLPFLYRSVCLMPDTHAGKGMPIGGVIALMDVVIPNAVGVDIGCGMCFVVTNIKYDTVREIQTGNGGLIQSIIGDIMRTIPVGREKHHRPQKSMVLDQALRESKLYESEQELLPLLKTGYEQIGTLGGGNHFIEIQQDENGYLCIMIHSGSRHLGNGVCVYFNEVAQKFNHREKQNRVPEEYQLAYLYTDSNEGQQYLKWMQFAMDYALENRQIMMEQVCEIVKEKIERYSGQQVQFVEKLDCHHNFAALEEHFGEKVWVHRKGAVRAKQGERVIIPGAMGSYSYIAEGTGNEEAFHSCSHGAGRLYSRTQAMAAFSTEKVILDLREQGVVLGKRNKKDVAEESRFAYKDIEGVMQQQRDLVISIRRMKTLGVVKG